MKNIHALVIAGLYVLIKIKYPGDRSKFIQHFLTSKHIFKGEPQIVFKDFRKRLPQVELLSLRTYVKFLQKYHWCLRTGLTPIPQHLESSRPQDLTHFFIAVKLFFIDIFIK